MSEKMLFLFKKEDVERVSEVIEDGRKIIFIDVHGMSVKEADKFLKAIILLDREGNDLCVIHGYVHGTKIKEHIFNEKISDRILDIRTVKYNMGRTMLKVKAA